MQIYKYNINETIYTIDPKKLYHRNHGAIHVMYTSVDHMIYSDDGKSTESLDSLKVGFN